MKNQTQQTQKIKLLEYGIGDFTKKIQELFEQGYRIDFEDNDSFPVNYGTFYEAGMVLKVNEPKPDAQDLNISPEVVAFVNDEVQVLSTETVEIQPKESVVITESDVGNLSDILPDLVPVTKPKAGRPKKVVQE